MLTLLRPFLFTMWRSRAFKELIVDMATKVATRTDNDLDDLAVAHLRNLLLPDTRTR